MAGLDYLRRVSAEIRLPTFAIGGVTMENLPDVLSEGIDRIAVGAAVVDADDPACAARQLLDMLNGARDQSHTAAEAASPSLTSDL